MGVSHRLPPGGIPGPAAVRSERCYSIRRAEKGFTLIEVLVVVAIIALLVAILIPSLKAARRQARIVQCAAHLRVIGQALVFYLEANDDTMPGGGNSFELIHKYVQKVAPGTRPELAPSGSGAPYVNIEWYLCPGDSFYHTTNQVEHTMPDGSLVWAQYALSYGRNGSLGRKMSKVKRPSSIVSYCDLGDDGHWGGGTWVLNESTILPNGQRNNQTEFEVHHGTGNNFLYCDTHIQYHKVLVNTPPQYGLPPYPQAWNPNWKPGDFGGRYDDYVRDPPMAYDWL